MDKSSPQQTNASGIKLNIHLALLICRPLDPGRWHNPEVQRRSYRTSRQEDVLKALDKAKMSTKVMS